MILDNADMNIGGMWIASDDGVLNYIIYRQSVRVVLSLQQVQTV